MVYWKGWPHACIFELGFKIPPWPILFMMTTVNNTEELLYCALHSTFPILTAQKVLHI